MSPVIVIGHEMIHGNRSMNGVASYEKDFTSYIYKDKDGALYKTRERTEELHTVGISGNYEYTENKLRKEQGYNQRIQY